ncbi:MAG TPA: YigZ family protein [Sulfuricurvum sp.]|nr:YigZ family protein [Sulfuricurvum sp.]
MVTVDSIFTDTIEIKQSKFMAYLMPIALYEDEMKHLREKHPKAVHFVSAYQMLNEFDQIVEYSGDDGEPKGTSGKPTLSVLQGHDLINAAIITVRYFGGTKLGPGGLVRAYAEAANAAVSAASMEAYEKLYRSRIQCEYSNISIVEYEISRNRIQILSKVFDERGGIFHIEASREDLEHFYTLLGRCITRI